MNTCSDHDASYFQHSLTAMVGECLVIAEMVPLMVMVVTASCASTNGGIFFGYIFIMIAFICRKTAQVLIADDCIYLQENSPSSNSRGLRLFAGKQPNV